MLRSTTVLLAALLLIAAGPARAVTIDFEEFGNGDIVAAPIASHTGYTLVAENYNKPFDISVAFDTNQTGSEEPDMEFGTGWAAGNIKDKDLGNILMLQALDTCSATHCTDLNNEGKRPAGKFTFLLDDSATSFSFDLVDVESATMENGRITFFLLEDGKVDVKVSTFAFADFLTLGQGVEYGNQSANHVFLDDIGSFNAFAIEMGGSGGIDNIETDGTPVPEPASVGLLGLGLVGVAIFGRRHSR